MDVFRRHATTLEVARGLLHRPGVLFLDEPTIGLDPQTRDHIGIIDHGHIIALDSSERLKERIGGDIITLESPQPAQALERLHSHFQLEALIEGKLIRIEATEGERLVPHLITELGVPVEPITDLGVRA